MIMQHIILCNLHFLALAQYFSDGFQLKKCGMAEWVFVFFTNLADFS